MLSTYYIINHMKKIIVLILVFTQIRASAQKTYIRFNPDQCRNCAAALYTICDIANPNSVQLIMKERYSVNLLQILDEYGISARRTPNLEPILSDSMYRILSTKLFNTLPDTECGAEVIIIDDKGILFRKNIQHLDVSTMKQYYTSSDSTGGSLCFASMIGLGAFRTQGPFIIPLGEHSQFAVIDKKSKSEIVINIDEALKKRLYHKIYKDSFYVKYPIINEIIKETPLLKPTIEDVIKWDDENLMVLCNVKNYSYNERGDSLFLINSPLVTKFNIGSQAVSDIYLMDHSIPSEFSFWYLFIEKDKYYAQGYKDNNFCLIELNCDSNLKKFGYKKVVINTKPESYTKRKVSVLEENSIVIRGNMVAFVFDNKITLLDNMKHVYIPFKNYESEKWNAFRIRDLFEDDKNYYVLYIHKNNHHVMQLPKSGDISKDVIIESTSAVDLRHMKFYDSGNQVLYKPKNKNCLFIKQFSF